MLVALTASLAHLSLGTVLAYPAIAVPQLTKPLLPELNRRHNATLRETYNQSQVGEAPPLVYLLDNSTESLDRLNYTLTPSSTPSSRLPRPHEVWLSHSQATWFGRSPLLRVNVCKLVVYKYKCLISPSPIWRYADKYQIRIIIRLKQSLIFKMALQN